MGAPLLLDSLEIRQFRTFEHLQIKHLGRVNLIVGKNNVGKSSLLEALWLYAHQGSPEIIWQILAARNEGRRPGLRESKEVAQAIKHLFNGRPDFDREVKPIRIGAYNAQSKVLLLSLNWFAVQSDAYGNQKLKRIGFEEYRTLSEPILGLTIQYEDRTLFQRLDQSNLLIQEVDQNNCVFISANGLTHSRLGQLWDSISLTSLEDEVIEALRIIAPEVERVNLVEGGRRSLSGQERITIVKTKGNDEPIPLRSLGEGMNRLFGIALALGNAKNGLLLIDEIESGLHYSVQPDVWRLVFGVARRLNIQVFATTHSWDCIAAFQQAAQEDKQEEGVLIRLTERKGKVVADLFDENELGIATREEVELR